MKINKLIGSLGLFGLLLMSCNDFDEINTDPKAASSDQVRVEYILNASITGAQMDPEVAERSFVLYWKSAGRQHRKDGFATGGYNDGWTSAYYNQSSDWQKNATLAISIADEKIAKGFELPYDAKMVPNMREVARIWRAYLMSEFCDNFGPMPVDAFQGKNPEFSDVKTVYYFILAELKDAASKIDVSVQPTDDDKKYDRFYGFDFSKWVKYANSMRLRLAMRLSEVDPAKAQSEFEDAVKGTLILDAADNVTCKERSGGWDALSGVMSREWNEQMLSATLNNLMIDLGGIKTESSLADSYKSYIKEPDYMGVKYEKHYSSMTNDPSAGFYFDGLYNKMDPRAYKLFAAPGDFDNPEFCTYPSYDNNAETVVRNLLNDDKTTTLEEIDASFTWNATPIGSWGDKGALNQVYSFVGTNPRLVFSYRKSTNSRIFFASWETYFLIAEAAVRGWKVPISGEDAYKKGIEASFAHHDLSKFTASYLASTDYNRVGTSVKWDHTAEPPATKQMSMVDGYSKSKGTYEFKYPVAANNLYNKALNDQLTKVITQKFIANTPWLPLETWSDHRRLGLPFFEVPCVEKPLVNMPDLTQSNYMKPSVKFFPQRIKYPASLQDSNREGYDSAVQLLGGADAVLTPLWWAKKQ